MHGHLQTSRTGRVRYPPLAFWLSETKVHDKQGGAVAIARPAALPHAKSTKPQPASQTVPDKRHGNRQHTSSEQPAVPSKSTGKPAAAADDVATEAPTQPSTQVTASSPAHTAKARAAAVSPGRVKHKPPAASQPARSAKACLKKQPDAASNDPATQVQQAECAANAGGALPGSMQVPGIDLSAATAAAAACADPFAASAALAAAVATAKGPGAARLRACGICKHCLKPSLRKACLVLKALKEALAGGQTATACHSNEAAQHSKAGKACQRSTAGKAAQSNATAAAEQSDEVSECTQAGTTGKAFNTKAVKSAAAAAAVEGVKGVKTGKAKAASRKRHRQEDTEESECITVPSTSAGDTAEVSQRSQTSSESSDVSEQVQPKRKSLPVKRADGKVSCGTGSVDVAGRKLYKRNKAVLDDPSSDVKLTKHKGQGKRKQAASGQVAAVEARAGIAAGSKVSKGSIPNRKASTSKGPAGGPAKAGASLTGEQPKAAAAGKASRHRARPAATDQGASPVQFLAIEGVEAEEQQAAEALQCLSQSSQGQPHDSHASLQRNQAPAASEQLPKATASSCRNARPMQRSLADVLQHSEPTTGEPSCVSRSASAA